MTDAQPTPSLREEVLHVEREILYALTDPCDSQPLWSLEDLGRELGQLAVEDALPFLQSAGLINRTADGHVFATRASVRLIQIVGRVD